MRSLFTSEWAYAYYHGKEIAPLFHNLFRRDEIVVSYPINVTQAHDWRVHEIVDIARPGPAEMHFTNGPLGHLHEPGSKLCHPLIRIIQIQVHSGSRNERGSTTFIVP